MRRFAWQSARHVAAETVSDEDARARGRAITPGFGEMIAVRRCWVCSSDDVALTGWVSVGEHVVCGDCSRAALGGVLPYGRVAATYRGRVGSPRRALGEAYQAVVAFKERRDDWVTLAEPLARALSRSIKELLAGGDRGEGLPPMLVPVPSYRGRRPHVRMLTALAAVQLTGVSTHLDLMVKTRDFRQKGLSRADREAESNDAYTVRATRRIAVHGRRVIVADDLITTGATQAACAQTLLEAGAASVEGAAILRVIRAPPERVLPLGSRQVRLQLRELDSRGRTPVEPNAGMLWVQFACSVRCPETAAAGPYPLPTLDVVGYHRWMCRCGSSHLIRMRREWRGDTRECVVVAVGDRRPKEMLVGILQGPPSYVR
jgi:predicted amidophosphoribosyltransferase